MKMARVFGWAVLGIVGMAWSGWRGGNSAYAAGAQRVQGGPQLAVLDTDIGDDIDDAFALALLLESPEVKLLGITATYGKTELRGRLLDRYLAAAGRSDIPVAVGRQTPQSNTFSQAAYASREPDHPHADAVTFLLEQIKAHPGEITLIAIGPLVNVQDAIARDPATFRRLKRVVMMGGSIERGYDTAASKNNPPSAEWNIARDPEGAQALLASGVPVFMMPLDSTQVAFANPQRDRLFGAGSAVTDQLTLLYHEWLAVADNRQPSPTLYDPVAAAYAVRPELCPMKPIRLEVDGKGFTRPVQGNPNAEVCLHSDQAGFVDFLVQRITASAH